MLVQHYIKRSWFCDHGKKIIIDKMKKKYKSLDSCNATQISSEHS